jgi:hypothetical protein
VLIARARLTPNLWPVKIEYRIDAAPQPRLRYRNPYPLPAHLLQLMKVARGRFVRDPPEKKLGNFESAIPLGSVPETAGADVFLFYNAKANPVRF